MNQEAIKLAQMKLSLALKSEQVANRHEGDMVRDATLVPSSGNRGYSRNRTLPFKGTPLHQSFRR